VDRDERAVVSLAEHKKRARQRSVGADPDIQCEQNSIIVRVLKKKKSPRF
jgi:hypothetical protein